MSFVRLAGMNLRWFYLCLILLLVLSDYFCRLVGCTYLALSFGRLLFYFFFVLSMFLS